MKMAVWSLLTRSSVSRLMRFLGLSHGIVAFIPRMMQFSGIPFIDWLVWRVVHADVISVVSEGDCTDHASIVDVVYIGYKASERGWFRSSLTKRQIPFCFSFFVFANKDLSAHSHSYSSVLC